MNPRRDLQLPGANNVSCLCSPWTHVSMDNQGRSLRCPDWPPRVALSTFLSHTPNHRENISVSPRAATLRWNLYSEHLGSSFTAGPFISYRHEGRAQPPTSQMTARASPHCLQPRPHYLLLKPNPVVCCPSALTCHGHWFRNKGLNSRSPSALWLEKNVTAGW